MKTIRIWHCSSVISSDGPPSTPLSCRRACAFGGSHRSVDSRLRVRPARRALIQPWLKWEFGLPGAGLFHRTMERARAPPLAPSRVNRTADGRQAAYIASVKRPIRLFPNTRWNANWIRRTVAPRPHYSFFWLHRSLRTARPDDRMAGPVFRCPFLSSQRAGEPNRWTRSLGACNGRHAGCVPCGSAQNVGTGISRRHRRRGDGSRPGDLTPVGPSRRRSLDLMARWWPTAVSVLKTWRCRRKPGETHRSCLGCADHLLGNKPTDALPQDTSLQIVGCPTIARSRCGLRQHPAQFAKRSDAAAIRIAVIVTDIKCRGESKRLSSVPPSACSTTWSISVPRRQACGRRFWA